MFLKDQEALSELEHDFFEFNKNYEEDDEPAHDGDNVKKRLKGNIQGFKLVEISYVTNINQVRVYLNSSLREFIQKEILTPEVKYNMAKLYLKYMAITMRQLIASIKAY